MTCQQAGPPIAAIISNTATLADAEPSDSESYQLMEHSLYESFSSLANAFFCTWDMFQLHDGQDFTITHGYHLLSVKITAVQDVQAVVSVLKN